jgi:hypothetical protein
MKLLFLDDSFIRNSWFFGYGGFCIDSSAIRSLSNELAELKSRHGLPLSVELKWSPGPHHFLRARFVGVRHELYRSAINILSNHDAKIICAVHALRECYGVRLHGWSQARATQWAAKQQLRFIAERFDRPYLAGHNSEGIIVCDQFGSRDEESIVTSQFSADMLVGTEFSKMERITHVPLMTESKHSPALQLADIVVGAVTSALAGGRYGIALFDEIAPLFLWNPHERAVDFASMLSAAVIGYGLKLFPKSIERQSAQIFKNVDLFYDVTKKEGVRRIPLPTVIASAPLKPASPIL